jgi:type IV pilus biogenesis protein CpaD/CtpE
MQKRVSLITVVAGGLLVSWSVAFAGGSDTDRRLSAREYQNYNQRVPSRNCNIESSFDTVGFDGGNEFDNATGCSVQTGIALMAANKKDLVKGRGSRFSDGERAANIVTDYRAWKNRSPAPHGQENR